MKDPIDRQDALDAFKVCLMIGRGSGKSIAFNIINVYADIVRKRIEALPSAQPESEHTMEEFMYGQDLGSSEDGSL